MTTTIAGTDGGLLGGTQTWQNLTASRASGTAYTNSTGKPISIEVVMLISSGSPGYVVDKSGVTQTIALPGAAVGVKPIYSAIIPTGGSYSVTCNAGTAISNWLELR